MSKTIQREPTPSRKGDRLLQLPEVCETTTLTEATHRYMRHRGEGPPIFKLGRRLVCWESDLLAWIDREARKEVGLQASEAV